MPVRIDLNINSGLPDPHWTLNQEQETQLLHYLESLPKAPNETMPEERYGYRGLSIIFDKLMRMQDLTMVFKGFVYKPYGDPTVPMRRDIDRKLEIWLLNIIGTEDNKYKELLKEVLKEV